MSKNQLNILVCPTTLITWVLIILTIIILRLAITETVNPPQKAGSDPPPPISNTLPATFKEVEMDVSAYCKNSCCTGRFADGITASGAVAEGLICAADPKYPFGTKMTVGDVVYTVEDRGGLIKENKLDILFPTHKEALKFGRKTLKVKVWK